MMIDKIKYIFVSEKNTDSSFIKNVSYSRHNKMMTVVFRDGSSYRYGSVEPSTYREFMVSPSKGKFFHSRIRDSYPFIKSSK